MIDLSAWREVIKQYERHGWTLRRVLLSDAPENISTFEKSFGGAQVVAADIDALWFSRAAAAAGGEAWELRRVSGAPFALVDVFGADEAEAAREKKRRAIEIKLRAR